MARRAFAKGRPRRGMRQPRADSREVGNGCDGAKREIFAAASRVHDADCAGALCSSHVSHTRCRCRERCAARLPSLAPLRHIWGRWRLRVAAAAVAHKFLAESDCRLAGRRGLAAAGQSWLSTKLSALAPSHARTLSSNLARRGRITRDAEQPDWRRQSLARQVRRPVGLLMCHCEEVHCQLLATHRKKVTAVCISSALEVASAIPSQRLMLARPAPRVAGASAVGGVLSRCRLLLRAPVAARWVYHLELRTPALGRVRSPVAESIRSPS